MTAAQRKISRSLANKKWRANNPGKAKAARLSWEDRHPGYYANRYEGRHDAALAERKAWRLANPKYFATYRKRRRADDPVFKLLDNLSSRLRMALKRGSKSASTHEFLGCTGMELRHHLESLFQPGMSWANYGRGGWHVDHKRPCASFDLADPEQQRACFHYTNLQPLWELDNLKKGSKS